jgi:hypothetical protein
MSESELAALREENAQLRQALQALIDRARKLPKRFRTDLEWDEVSAAEKLLTQKNER